MIKSVEEALRKYWGFDGFLPLQREAMSCVCEGRDSIVVLPTGGGNSLCFQAPALLLPGLTLAVSPLLSLMKVQVGYRLAPCHAGMTDGECDQALCHGR